MDGFIFNWDYDNQQWERGVYEVDNDFNSNVDDNITKIKGVKVALKNLDKSSNLNDEFLNEVPYLY